MKPQSTNMKLFSLRKEAGLTQKEVAKLVGITQKTYRLIEQKVSAPSLTTAFALVEVFGLQHIEDLFDKADFVAPEDSERRKEAYDLRNMNIML